MVKGMGDHVRRTLRAGIAGATLLFAIAACGQPKVSETAPAAEPTRSRSGGTITGSVCDLVTIEDARAVAGGAVVSHQDIHIREPAEATWVSGLCDYTSPTDSDLRIGVSLYMHINGDPYLPDQAAFDNDGELISGLIYPGRWDDWGRILSFYIDGIYVHMYAGVPYKSGKLEDAKKLAQLVLPRF